MDELHEENFHKGLLLVIAESLYLCLNVTQIDFNVLVSNLNVDIFEIWNALYIFLQYLNSLILDLMERFLNN